MHIEFLLEEPSAEAFLNGFLPRVLPEGTTWNPIVFQGKPDLLSNLETRLKGYRMWIPEDWRIVVLVDEDRQDCSALKTRMEAAALSAGFGTKTTPRNGTFVIVNRIAVEELAAWFFGDITALMQAFPRVPASLASKAAYRNADGIAGGTWEALERVLRNAGYYAGGLPKIQVARQLSTHVDPVRNTSSSFRNFLDGIRASLN